MYEEECLSCWAICGVNSSTPQSICMTVLMAGASYAAGRCLGCLLGRRLLHHTHHKYNKEHTLSPFAGLAFNALDGILQVLVCAVLWLHVALAQRLERVFLGEQASRGFVSGRMHA